MGQRHKPKTIEEVLQRVEQETGVKAGAHSRGS